MTSSLLGLLVSPDEDFDPKENNHSGGEKGQKHSARQIACVGRREIWASIVSSLFSSA
jgi:hypothetical protein